MYLLKHKDTLLRGKLHFFVILAGLIMQLFDVSTLYRFFAYLNILVVLLLLPSTLDWKNSLDKKQLYRLLAIPLCFIFLHFLTTFQFEYTKEIRRITAATFLGLGIWMLARNNARFVLQHLANITLATLFIFVAAQIIALWYLKMPFGIFDNPHYLAFYSASLLMLAIFMLLKASSYLKWSLAICALLLGYFLLLSQSRPTWIGLICSGILLLWFLQPALRKRVFVTFILVLIGLTVFNVGNFAGRFGDLLQHLATEERATIWRDAWQLQMTSSPSQWLIGHGLSLSAYEEAFKSFSQYHLEDLDYNTPHNFVLEILYASGLIGLSLFAILLLKLYQTLLGLIKAQDTHHQLYILLLLVFTTNFITVSITVPFTSVYNINMMALIFGILLFIPEKNTRTGA